MGEILKKLVMESEKKTDGLRFRLEESSDGRQVLILIDSEGNTIARHGLDPRSDCASCPYYCGQCVCNCPLIG